MMVLCFPSSARSPQGNQSPKVFYLFQTIVVFCASGGFKTLSSKLKILFGIRWGGDRPTHDGASSTTVVPHLMEIPHIKILSLAGRLFIIAVSSLYSRKYPRLSAKCRCGV